MLKQVDKLYQILLLVTALMYWGCQPKSEISTIVNIPEIKSIPTPAKTGSGEPNLFTGHDGKVYLSWIEPIDSIQVALKFSTLENDDWAASKTIASGSDWFVNWADFPALAVNKDGIMAAHWLLKRSEGMYDYDIYVSQSKDQGTNWSKPFILHNDGIAAEHGFVCMIPLADQTIFAAWLDGRNTKAPEHNDHTTNDSHAGGSMSIRAAQFDAEGLLSNEILLDSRVCDCCQTDAALTSNGPVVVYRDRSEKEIRDIAIVRSIEGKWTEPQVVHRDDWEIAGCPVNGPRVEAMGDHVAVAWFTGANNKNQAKLAFSSDGGASFGPPIQIDEGKPLGRMDLLMLEDHSVMVTWMEGKDQGAEIRASQITPGGNKKASFTIAQNSESRASGFPRMSRDQDRIYWAWTQVDSTSLVQTAYLDMI
ncbi:MAG: sialidase family protein [Cyclobacteriaceae bacterium]